MSGLKCAAITLILVICRTLIVKSCENLTDLSGTIWDEANTYYSVHERCWNIHVPQNSFIRLQFKEIQLPSCSDAYVRFTIPDLNERHKFCISKYISPFTALNDVQVTHYVNANGRYASKFNIQYVIQDIECSHINSFRCNNHSCIPQTEVCDGVKDCKNGIDEVGCETGILSMVGIKDARDATLSWMKRNRIPSWGWQRDTPRAIVALYLAGGANFDGTSHEEEVMAMQADLVTSLALLRSTFGNNELSIFVNAQLVTCRNPRNFYGYDLVQRLKEQVQKSQNFTHPVAYLALCNANKTWPTKAVTDLNSILRSDSEYPFTTDIQAMAVTALSCAANSSKSIKTTFGAYTQALYLASIKRFKELQLQDGSFGNVYTTSLITQALIASGREYDQDWKLNATIKYLIKKMNSSSIDFLSSYLTLPILNGKSLSDVSKVNCTDNPRVPRDDPISESAAFIGPRMRIQYSLYVGDARDVIHTISLRVPENFTAFDVMELAEVKDPKYKFQWKLMSGKMYVYDIAGVTNDSEAGKFWLMYVGGENSEETLRHYTTGPDELILDSGDHLIMWYKTSSL